MSRNIWVVAASACFLAASGAGAAEVTADELLAKNLAARGGAQALAAIDSLRLKGKLRFPGDFELDYIETRARKGNNVRVDAALQGLSLVQAYDGTIGWRINPFQGRRDADKMSDDEARSLADTGTISGVLQDARAKGSRVEYLGREDFDGTLAYKLKVSEKDGDQFVYLLDPDTFLEIGMTETRRLRGAEQVNEYEFGDYEKVAGVYFPMSVETWPRGSQQRQKTLVESGEANIQVAASTFMMPGQSTPNTRGATGSSTDGSTDAMQAAPPSPAPEPPTTIEPTAPKAGK